MTGMIYIWIGVLILMVIIEGLTMTSLATIWFIPGTLLAMLLAAFHVSIGIQIAVFLISAVISVIVTFPMAKKLINDRTKSTNYERIIGTNGIVQEEINNLKGTGRVKVDGKDWTARAKNEKNIFAVGDVVRIDYIEGVKLFVEGTGLEVDQDDEK